MTTHPLTIGAASRTQRHARERRAGLTIGGLALAVVALFALSMMLGTFALSLGEVVSALFGNASKSVSFVVLELRLPRAAAAVLVGLALGAAGTLFQRVLGNPLASPDFLGVASGAGTATVAALVLFSASGLMLPIAATLGAVTTAVLIYVLAWRRGVTGYRFILVGIGVAAVAQSITSYLTARAEFSDARAAMTWLVGSVGMASFESLMVLLGAVALFLLVTPIVGKRLTALELGDDTARGLGAAPQRDRLIVIGCAVVLVAAATAAAGPIAFIALLAGPLSAILLGHTGARLWAAALMGAVLLQVCDLAAQYALPWPISTGVVTGFVGAPYIAWLLINSQRKGTSG